MAALQARRDRTAAALRAHGYALRLPEATFYLLVRAPIEDDAEFARRLQKDGVLVLPGRTVEMPGHFRISLTATDDMADRALPVFAAAGSGRPEGPRRGGTGVDSRPLSLSHSVTAPASGGVMSFVYQRRYQGRVRAVLLDRAGTTMDFGCLAPAVVFVKVFERAGVPITIDEARASMGAHKRVHVQEITRLPSARAVGGGARPPARRRGRHPHVRGLRAAPARLPVEINLRDAGMWTIGLAVSGNEVGLSLDEWKALPEAERQARRQRAYERLHRAGAHYVVDPIAAVPPCIEAIEAIEARLARGERP